jgi:5,6-dimethylbenzimidazole synthase
MVKSLVVDKSTLSEEDVRDAIYRVIAARRDVRSGFTSAPLPEELLLRLLSAAHCAPSVGLMQPSRFIVIRDINVRAKVHDIFQKANTEALASYEGDQKERYAALKLEGILEAPQNLCVLCDPTSTRGHKLGRHTMPETAIYSTVCAIQNLWLAARAEGVGVGWVSILDPLKLQSVLKIPEHIVPVAYLCLGYVDHFASEPELERLGWENRVPLDHVISYEQYSEADQP